MKNALKPWLALFIAFVMVFGGAPLGALAGLTDWFGGPMAYAAGDVWDGSVATVFARGSGAEDDPYIIETASQLAYLSSSVDGGTMYEGKFINLENDIVLNPPDVFACDEDGNITGKADGKTTKAWTSIGGRYQPLSISNETEFNAAKLTYGTLYCNPATVISSYSSSYSTYYYLAEFRGTFDGCGHTVSGIYIDTEIDYQGLFGYAGGIINNIGVKKSFIKGGGYVGGVTGYNDEGTVSNCYNTGIVTGSDYGVGGVAGVGIYCQASSCSS